MNAGLATRPPVQPIRADEVQVIHPDTGELLDLATATVGQLAGWRQAVRAWELNAQLAKQLVDAALIARMDARNEHTLREDGFEVSAPASTERTTYDAPALRDALTDLFESGTVNLDPAAINDALPMVVTYKPVVAKINGLRKRGGPILEAIEAHSQTVPVDRRVTVKGGA